MHLETLLYMLVQSSRIHAPPGTVPDFKALARQAKRKSVPNEWIEVPATTLNIGMEDPENDLGPERYFGWDNEKPSRHINVSAFQAKARPITNEEYAQYLEQTHRERIPASWTSTAEKSDGINAKQQTRAGGEKSNAAYLNGNGAPLTDSYLNGKSVRTVYGPIPLRDALDWPVFASYDELSGCAKWMDGRIPTADEARSIYNYVESRKVKEAEKVQVQTISAVNG